MGTDPGILSVPLASGQELSIRSLDTNVLPQISPADEAHVRLSVRPAQALEKTSSRPQEPAGRKKTARASHKINGSRRASSAGTNDDSNNIAGRDVVAAQAENPLPAPVPVRTILETAAKGNSNVFDGDAERANDLETAPVSAAPANSEEDVLKHASANSTDITAKLTPPAGSAELIPARHELAGQQATLRTPTKADYPALGAVLNDQTTMDALIPLFGTAQWTAAMVRKYYQGFQRKQQAGHALSYAIFSNASGKVVGHCAIMGIDPAKGMAEFGIILHNSVWGTGIAHECAKLCFDYAFKTLRLGTVWFETSEQNIRVRKLAEKAHIPQKGAAPIEGYLRYELSREAWFSSPLSK